MHEYTKDAIVTAAQRCQKHLQLAHIYGHADWRVGAYHVEKAEEQSALAFQLVENDARARSIPTGDHWA